jgi:hypothetical protein
MTALLFVYATVALYVAAVRAASGIPEAVTCGSAIKLRHVPTSFRYHAHHSQTALVAHAAVLSVRPTLASPVKQFILILALWYCMNQIT